MGRCPHSPACGHMLALADGVEAPGCRHHQDRIGGRRCTPQRRERPRDSHLGGLVLRPPPDRTACIEGHRDPRHLALTPHRIAHLTPPPPTPGALGQPLDELLSGHCARAGDELPHGLSEEGHSVKTHRHQPRNSCRRTRWASANPAHTRWTSCRLDILRSDPTRMDSSWW